MTRPSFRLRLWAGFGAMSLAVVALAWVGLWVSGELARAGEWVRTSTVQEATAAEVGTATRAWTALIEGVAEGDVISAERLELAHHEVDRTIDALERAGEDAARSRADEEDGARSRERVAELRQMVARLALLSGQFRSGRFSQEERSQLQALGRRFGLVSGEIVQGARHQVEHAQREVDQATARATTLILGFVVGALVVAVLASIFLSRRLARSVTTLLDATKRMSSGELDIQTALGGNDEFAELARGFTRMSVDLSRSIEQRKQESAKAKQLAREAGVAYVTTGVLHNIGNALTSVNISLEMIQSSGVGERLRKLARVGDMLAPHGDDMAEFLQSDPKGSKLPQYLVALAPELQRDAEEFEGDLDHIRERVDHLVHILRAYQMHGTATLDYENADVEQLLHFAVDVALSAGRQTRYRIERKVDGLSMIRLDKHRTLQILINLIRNAADAVDESGREDGQLTVAAHPVEGTMVGFAVTDNGAGIAHALLDQIFTHGFTTKPADTGSGFGLHASANAAVEMGGRLLAHSDGPGKGAHFVLEIPFEEPRGGGSDGSVSGERSAG